MNNSTRILVLPPVVAVVLGLSFACGGAGADEKLTPAPQKPVRTDFYGDPLPAGALARMGSVRLRPGDGCFQILFSADGKELISLAADGAIRFWDTETGKELRTLAVKGGGFTMAAVSPDGKTLAACGADSIYIWDAKTHEQRTVLHVEGMGARCLALSPDGKTLASGGEDKIIRLWDVPSGKEQKKLEGHERPVVRLDFSPDGGLLAARDMGARDVNPVFRMWDVASGKTCWQGEAEGLRQIADFRFLPGGEGVDVWFNRRRVVNAKDGKELRVIDMTDQDLDSSPGLKVVSADGKVLIASTHVREIKKLFVRECKAIEILSPARDAEPEFLEENSETVTALALSPDGKTLATVECPMPFQQTNFITLWDLTARQKKDVPPGHKRGVGTVFFLPDAKTLVTGGGDGTIRFWEVASGKELRRLGSDKEPLDLLAASPDGAVLALRCPKQDDPDFGRIVHLLDAATGKELRPFERPALKKGGRPSVYTWVLSPDGKTLAAGTSNGVQLWDVASGNEVALPDGMQRPAYRLTFSPDGKTLAVVGMQINGVAISRGENGRTRFWDLKKGTERLVLAADSSFIGTPAFTPDGRLLVCSEREVIHLRDALTGKSVCHTNPDKTPARGDPIAFSPDGKLFAMPSASDINDRGHLISVLETATCREVCRFENGGRIVGGLTFAPDGARLASGYDDGAALVWDLQTVTGSASELPAHLDADALAHLWDDLDASDAAVGYRAVCALAGSPKEALELLTRRLTKAPPRDVEGVRRLIPALDSDDPKIRDAASRGLQEFGPFAELELKEAASSPTPEVSQRARLLLAAIDHYALPPGRLREIRAVQALERTATPEARRLLDALTEGEPLAPLTRDAKAAVERLGGKEARP